MIPVTVKLRRRITGFRIQEMDRKDSVIRADSLEKPEVREYHVPGIPNELEWKLEMQRTRTAQLEQALQQAREDYFAAGFKEGRAEAAKQYNTDLQNLKQQFESMAVQITEQAEVSVQNSEYPLLDLSIELALIIIRHELKNLDTAADRISDLLKKLLLDVIDQEKVTLQIHPDMLDRLNSSGALDNVDPAADRQIRYIANPALHIGDCILETPDFVIDSTVEKQLAHLENQLKAEN